MTLEEETAKLSESIQQAVLKLLMDTPKVPANDYGEKLVAEAIMKRCEEISKPCNVKVTCGQLTAEDRKAGRNIPINIEMDFETYNRIYVPMGYPSIEPHICITVKVEI